MGYVPPALPPAFQNLTPQQIAQLRAMGYLPGPRFGPRRPALTTQPANLSDLAPEVIEALRAAGYLPENARIAKETDNSEGG